METNFRITVILLATTNQIYSQYRDLSGHQVWNLEGKVDHVSAKLLEDGLADVLDLSGPMRQLKVSPDYLEEVRRVLHQNGIAYTVLNEDLETYLEKEDVLRSKRQTEVCTSTSCPRPLTDSYMTFEEIEWYLKELNSTYSSRVEVTSIGKSVEGRDIWQVLIKAYTCNEGNSIWLEGGIHAREWISPAVTLHLIDRLVKDCVIGKIFDIYVVPMANPDGYIYSWTNNRLWRKNRRDNPDSTCDGVDLNRNWDFDYGVGASSDFCSDVYKGTSAFSEPETLSLKTAMEKVNQENNLVMVIAIHSYGQVLLYPYGGTTIDAPFTTEMIESGNIFVNALQKSFGTQYRVLNSAEGFLRASGATDDWSKGVLKVKYAYTLELRDTGSQGFVLGTDKIAPSVQETWDGIKALLISVNPNNYTLL